MEISKIRPYEGYYDNSIGRVTGNSGSDQISNPIENFSTGKMQSVKPEQKQTFGAAEYADTYQPGKEYPLKGVDSDIRSLDVQKAVSDMKKDEVLHQYQFFVGHSASAETAKPVVPMPEIEDFSFKQIELRYGRGFLESSSFFDRKRKSLNLREQENKQKNNWQRNKEIISKHS